jgi:DNA-directed RNA polymerase specialized sigma24 family protein
MSDPSNCQAALVKRAIAGDADAFGELYLAHLDAIYRYVYRPRGNPFASWIYRIAHNLVIDYSHPFPGRQSC